MSLSSKLIFVLIILFFSQISAQQEEEQVKPQEQQENDVIAEPKIKTDEKNVFRTSLQLSDIITKGKCLEKYPYFSVGDIVLQDINFQKTIRKNKFLVVLATAGYCYGCCKQEMFYYNLYHHYLKNKQINPMADQTVMARYELAYGKDFAAEYPIKRFPYLIIFRETVPYYYSDIFDYARIMRFVRRIQQPLQKLDTLESLENFLNRSEKDYDGNIINTVKVVGFFFDPEETEEDQKEFFRAAEKSLEKTEIYFGMMTNPKEIRKVKQKYSDKFFADDVTLSGCIIQHYIGKYTIVDISDLILNMKQISQYIQANSFKLVEELTILNYKYYEAKNKPIMVFVVDTIIKWEQTKKFLRMIEEVAKEYFEVLKFVYVEGELNAEKKKMLGISHNTVPAMAFFRIDYSNKVSWPADWPINQVTIREFANDYLNKHIEYVIEKYERDVKKLKKSKLYAYLQNTIELKEDSYNQFIHSKKNNDIAILFLNSRKHLSEISIALNFNHIAKRFRDFEINSIEVCLYDTFYNNMPNTVQESPENPFIIIFKANTDRSSYILYDGEFKAEKLMIYLEQLSEGRFALPDLPHIPEDMLDEYLTVQANQDNFDEDQFLMPKEEL